MTKTLDAPSMSASLPAMRTLSVRLHLLARAARVTVTSMAGAVLFSVWLTAVAISPITVLAPLVLPATRWVRAYADSHRDEARRLTGWPMERQYRPTDDRSLVRRVWSVERDRQSWRDAWWCLLHAIVAATTSALTVTLFAGTLFYLSYPLLYWSTPQFVFGEPFGSLLVLHSVAQATVMMPLALVCFGLWYALVLPLTRVELKLTRSLLSPREPRLAP
jgi:hypothetical protein